MFYSQTFLARKGPLGTVWCAAHLEHRLKKSHYTSTNVSATVDLIMFPEVPLALRMSSHLLLGIVRIYSKQVDYLVHDCNVAIASLIKFAAIEVNLPEDARQAPVESVTLPLVLSLDDFNFDDEAIEGRSDNHLKSQEDITLEDQIPIDTDPYVAVTFDEDFFSDSRPMDVDSQSTVPLGDNRDIINEEEEAGATQTYQDTEPIDPMEMPNVDVDPQVPGTDNQTEEIQISPEIEKLRDAGPDLSPGVDPPFGPTQLDDTVELTECLDQTLNDNQNPSPIIEEETLNSVGNLSYQQNTASPAFTVLEEGPGNFGHSSPQLVLRSSPPPVQQQPEVRPRKRKLFDKATVLTNKIMKQRLEDCSDILRKKRRMPSVALGIWKLTNRSRKEQVFQEPLLTGFSEDLHNGFKRDYIISKPHNVPADEAVPESTQVLSPIQDAETETAVQGLTAVQSPNISNVPNPDHTIPQSPVQETGAGPDSRVRQSPDSGNEEATIAGSGGTFGTEYMDIEALRDGGLHEFTNFSTGFSPARTSDFAEMGTAGTTTPGFTAETASFRTEPETPRTIPEDLPVQGSGLPNIPEMDEDLSFLEGVSETPSSSQASQRGATLSVRARALARYFEGRSSSSPTSEGQSNSLSLNKILEGKTRKIAARMFFETLVLKSNKLIDVQQDKPYDDITLTLAPALSSKLQL